MSANLEELRTRLNALPPQDRLIVAAELIHAGKLDLAMVIVENVHLEYQAAKLLGKPVKA